MTLEWSPESAVPERGVPWHLLTDLRVSWWFGDTGRNAWRRSCEEGGEIEDWRGGGQGGRRKKRQGGAGSKKREREEGGGGVGEKKWRN